MQDVPTKHTNTFLFTPLHYCDEQKLQHKHLRKNEQKYSPQSCCYFFKTLECCFKSGIKNE